MAVMTTKEKRRLRYMNPVSNALRLDNRLAYLDSDGSYNGPITLDDVTDTLTIGSRANTAGSGVAIDADHLGAMLVYSDDAGASLDTPDSVRGMLSRFLLTVDQTGCTIRALQGQLKMATGVDVTSGVYTALQGYVELAGTHSAKTGSTFSCVDASLEIGTALTVDSGGEACVMHVETTGSGTITNNGTFAGILIDKASGAASMPQGIFIDGTSVIQGFRVGKFVGSAGTTTQVVFSTSQNVYSDGMLATCEIHGATTSNLTSAYNASCLRVRHVVSGSSMTAAHETYGVLGQLVVKGTTLTHLHAGVMGTLEGHTSGVVLNSAYAIGHAAVMARVGGGGAITATKPAAGFLAFWNGAALASGSSAAFATAHVTTAWKYGLYHAVGSVSFDAKVQAEDAGSLPCIIASGSATNDAGIVTQVGADTLWADGSLYISVVDGAGKLYQKQNDVWVDLQA